MKRLCLEILIYAFPCPFSTEPRCLYPTERGFGMANRAGTERHNTEFQRFSHAKGASQIACIEIVWAKYGEGFKMPTAQQLYTSLPGAFFTLTPAPNLRPEEVTSYELGVRYEENMRFVAVNGFYSEYSDFIQSFYNPPGTTQYTYRNISEVEIWGIEASGGFALGANTDLTFSAAWQKGRQRVEPTLPKTPHTLPPLTATVALKHEIPQYDLTLEGVATFAGDVKETESPTDYKPSGYALLDIYAKWEVVDDGFINLGVQNVFDTRYFTPNAATYGQTAASNVAATNPIELQTGPGRVFAINVEKRF